MCQWDLTWSGDVPRCEEGESNRVVSHLTFLCYQNSALSHLSLLRDVFSDDMPGPGECRAQSEGGHREPFCCGVDGAVCLQ